MFEFLKNLTSYNLQSRPEVNIGECLGCARCVSVCPSKAIGMFPWIPQVELPPKTGEPRLRPEINYQNCNRCYLCIKKCPHSAIEVHMSWMAKILRSRNQ